MQMDFPGESRQTVQGKQSGGTCRLQLAHICITLMLCTLTTINHLFAGGKSAISFRFCMFSGEPNHNWNLMLEVVHVEVHYRQTNKLCMLIVSMYGPYRNALQVH